MGKRTNTAVWSEKHQRWQINVQKDGKRRSFYSSTPGRAGQRGANAKADAWLDEGINPTGERVAALYEQFHDESVGTVGTAAIKQIETIGKVWIIPCIGRKKASDLCDGDIQKILDKAAAKGRSKKTIQDINGTINKFLKWCRRNKKTAYRPDDVHIPASARLKGKSVLQPDDLIKLLSSDKTEYKGKEIVDEYIHSYRLEVLTGIRPGELRGLRVEDIEGERVNIRRSINVHGETTKGKNENAVRSFVLSDLAREELEAQLREHPSESGFVFELPHQVTYRKHWQRYCSHNKIAPVTLYELRHTFVSVAKMLPVGEVKQLVGHSKSMDTFGVYGHALDGEDVQTTQKINGLFERIISPEKPAEK